MAPTNTPTGPPVPFVPTAIEEFLPEPRSGPSDTDDWAETLRRLGRLAGARSIGVTSAATLSEASTPLQAWLANGQHGQMEYMARDAPRRSHPTELFPDARSIMAIAVPYAPPLTQLRRSAETTARPIAAYALGTDYHVALKHKLRRIAQGLANYRKETIRARLAVDTAPLMEREAARRAGLGFFGKNTMLITPGTGTFTLLGVMLLDLELPSSSASAGDCGECRACLDACPTAAFPAAYQLDARRCISYLTIEYQGVIPESLRPSIGSRVYGCDACQTVCPYNRTADQKPHDEELAPRPQTDLSPLDLLQLTSGQYRRLVKGTAMRRASRQQLARNAAIVLGNSGDRKNVPALIEKLHSAAPVLVRQHVAWALGRLGGEQAKQALETTSAGDGELAEAIKSALLALSD
ncbi:MAG: tRNA epoxyqueuosine(34) reductase QueG [Polyangiaceae bacterium]|nr:tRNA epoxyqueuosine(34) reductase QueG [Polyangiaceae bacterium]